MVRLFWVLYSVLQLALLKGWACVEITYVGVAQLLQIHGQMQEALSENTYYREDSPQAVEELSNFHLYAIQAYAGDWHIVQY